MSTIDKILDTLEIVSRREKGIGIVELSNLSGLRLSTAHRIVSALVKRGYLSQPNKRGKYYPSNESMQFGVSTKIVMQLVDIAYSFLLELNSVTNEAVSLAILDKYEATIIEHFESNQGLRFTSHVGAKAPLHSTAVGKVLLAGMRDEEVEVFLKRKALPSRTENTITSVNRLEEELSAIKREGIALDDEEDEIGLKCIGAPIKDSKGAIVASMAISGPSARLNGKKIRELKRLIATYAMKISNSLGYGGD